MFCNCNFNLFINRLRVSYSFSLPATLSGASAMAPVGLRAVSVSLLWPFQLCKVFVAYFSAVANLTLGKLAFSIKASERHCVVFGLSALINFLHISFISKYNCKMEVENYLRLIYFEFSEHISFLKQA